MCFFIRRFGGDGGEGSVGWGEGSGDDGCWGMGDDDGDGEVDDDVMIDDLRGGLGMVV